MAEFAVMGAGAWGTALACHAARMEHRVTLWALEPEVVEDVNGSHCNSLYLPDLQLPEGIRATGDVAEAVDGAQVVVLVPPSRYVRAVSEGMQGGLAPDAKLVVASKGIEEGSLKLLSQVLRETLPEVSSDRIAFLSGPSFAREVAQGLPTDVALGSAKGSAARQLQPLLHADGFRVYASSDPVGVQVGGAVKNVMAVAAGVCDGLSLGANARAAVITRGLAEITRLGVALGADPLTFLGLAGVGDLILTCTGDLSRNRTLGKMVAQGADPQKYVESQRAVAEGYYTAAATHRLAVKLGVDMPITENVYHVLHEGRPLAEATRILVSRGFKDELAGIR